MTHRPQEQHADLGLVEDDLISDRRKAPVAAEALQKNYLPRELERKAR